MRLVVCGLSAVLLSGCSWFGGSGQSYNQKYLPKYSSQGQMQQAPMRGAHNPCVIYSPVQPVPQGCDPSMVTLATGSGAHGGQMPGTTYATGGYGSHAGQAGYSAHQPAQRLKKPRLRGALSLGLEKNVSGNLITPDLVSTLDPVAGYSPNIFNETFVEGSQTSGNITTTEYFADIDRTNTATVSVSDVYSTPMSLKGGFEYIVSPRTTVFANAGYSYAEGDSGSSVNLFGPLSRRITSQDYIPEPPPPPVATDVDTVGINPITGAPIVTTSTVFVPQPASGLYIPAGPPTVSTQSIPNENIANFHYDFSDMRRIDFEVGGRHYFNPIVKNEGFRTLTPFVGASAGMAHYNQMSYTIAQDQLDYSAAFEGGGGTQYLEPVLAGSAGATAAVNQTEVLFDSQWVPTGALTAGLEWQLTPKTALALESGLKYEKNRDYANGQEGDANIIVPVTLRGSFNF